MQNHRELESFLNNIDAIELLNKIKCFRSLDIKNMPDEEVFKYCHKFCDDLEKLVERKFKGDYWIPEFETDEMLFCKLYLTPFFKKMGFEQVIFNHGNKEFGKDYILVTNNIFGETEYYGV